MEPGAVEVRAARFSDRFIAYLIDTVPFAAGAVATTWVLLIPLAKLPTPRLLAAVGAAWITMAFGWQLLGNMAGGTPGKRLMGLRVLARDGEEPGFGRALARSLVWLLGHPLANVGFLLALLNRENRALHDYAAGTVVVEAYPKSAGEGAAVFVAAALAAAGLFAFQLRTAWARPTPSDVAALAKAREGLGVIGAAQEAYKAKNGTYAATTDELASVSGDPEKFLKAMSELFDGEGVVLEAGNRAWRIRARARDRARTPISAGGP